MTKGRVLVSRASERERYSGGYDRRVITGLSRRTVSTEGAFFLPYLRAGMDVLDCGCGPGTMTVEIAEIVTSGIVVGVDLESSQLAIGQERARELDVRNVCFQQASIYQLPFPDASFDAVYAHAVLYHLRHPGAALQEVHRVLRPGGIVAVRDSDTRGDLCAPPDPLLDRVWALAETVIRSQGGNPEFGRTQRAALHEAGFVDLVASASYDAYGETEAIQGYAAFWAAFLTIQHAELIVAEGWATREELDTLAAALTQWGIHPDAFAARARCEVVGWKRGDAPGAAGRS